MLHFVIHFLGEIVNQFWISAVRNKKVDINFQRSLVMLIDHDHTTPHLHSWLDSDHNVL